MKDWFIQDNYHVQYPTYITSYITHMTQLQFIVEVSNIVLSSFMDYQVGAQAMVLRY